MKTSAFLMHHGPVTEYFFAEGCFITEWWNTSADEAVSVARTRVEPGVTTRWHRAIALWGSRDRGTQQEAQRV